MRIEIENAGFHTTLNISDDEINNIHRPLLKRFDMLSCEKRAIVFVAGPPGSGKSTLCAIWERLAKGMGLPMITAPLDGFHFSNAQLKEKNLTARKGSPASFDVKSFRERLAAVRRMEPTDWPVYDRNLHEPVDGRLTIADEPVVLVEGNYLLLNRPEWRAAAVFSDFSIFIHSESGVLRQRVVGRHVKGGRSREESERKFDMNDVLNIRLVIEESVLADVTLIQTSSGGFIRAVVKD